MSYDPSLFAFVDIETTGLDPLRHHVWEIAFIIDDQEIGGLLRLPDDFRADVAALRVNRLADRYDAALAQPPGAYFHELYKLLQGRHLVGANPGFDMAFLANEFDRWDCYPAPPWHYRPICVESMTQGRLGRYVKGLKGCAEALGLTYDDDQAHSALHDARLAKAIFDRLMGKGSSTAFAEAVVDGSLTHGVEPMSAGPVAPPAGPADDIDNLKEQMQ